MTIESENKITINSESDIVLVRKKSRNKAKEMGFGMTDVTRIITAVSELARNIFKYAGSGYMEWHEIYSGNRIGLELLFVDTGPGIPNIDEVMQQGFSTSKGLGMGLPGSKRLMDDFIITSEVGKGTTVIIKKWLK